MMPRGRRNTYGGNLGKNDSQLVGIRYASIDAKESLAGKIREGRITHGLNMDELAQAMDQWPSTISRWEAGKGEPSLEELASMASMWGVSVDWFFEDAGKTREQHLVEIETSTGTHRLLTNLDSSPKQIDPGGYILRELEEIVPLVEKMPRILRDQVVLLIDSTFNLTAVVRASLMKRMGLVEKIDAREAGDDEPIRRPGEKGKGVGKGRDVRAMAGQRGFVVPRVKTPDDWDAPISGDGMPGEGIGAGNVGLHARGSRPAPPEPGETHDVGKRALVPGKLREMRIGEGQGMGTDEGDGKRKPGRPKSVKVVMWSREIGVIETGEAHARAAEMGKVLVDGEGRPIPAPDPVEAKRELARRREIIRANMMRQNEAEWAKEAEENKRKHLEQKKRSRDAINASRIEKGWTPFPMDKDFDLDFERAMELFIAREFIGSITPAMETDPRSLGLKPIYPKEEKSKP